MVTVLSGSTPARFPASLHVLHRTRARSRRGVRSPGDRTARNAHRSRRQRFRLRRLWTQGLTTLGAQLTAAGSHDPLHRSSGKSIAAGDAYAGSSSVVVSRLRLLRANPFTYLIAPGVVYFAAYASSTAAFVRSDARVTARTRSSRPAAWIRPMGSFTKA